MKPVEPKLREFLAGTGGLAIVKAPPGSGKTFLLVEEAAWLAGQGARVAVAAQTRSQADDICRRLAERHPTIQVCRWAGSADRGRPLGPSVSWAWKPQQVRPEALVVVATSAKWGVAGAMPGGENGRPGRFDVLFIEEAWQLTWADFMLMARASARFVLIGDPGQVSPVVDVDARRWETGPRAPQRAAPEVLLEEGQADPIELPRTRRLPHDSALLVREFYDFPFGSEAGPGERRTFHRGAARDVMGRALGMLSEGTVVAMTLPTPSGGPPLTHDLEAAALAVEAAVRLASGATECEIGGERRTLEPEDVGLVATHRVMNSAMHRLLPAGLRGRVRIDTPERWQGLECKTLVMVHPLSGVVRPSAFDLETGRLCVMASRHRAGLLVVTRDHLRTTLESYLPVADQAPGRPDGTGRGHARNLAFWNALERDGRVVPSTRP